MRCVRKSSPYGSIWGGFSFSAVGLPVTLSWQTALGGRCRGRAFNSRGTRGSPALWACLWLDRVYEVTHGSDFTAQRWETVLFRPAGGRRRGERLGVSRCDSQGSRRAGQLGAGGGHSLGPRGGSGCAPADSPPTSPGPRLSRPRLDGCEPCPTASRLPR